MIDLKAIPDLYSITGNIADIHRMVVPKRLLDRLEAAEVEVTEQARLLGVSAEKELLLMAKLEAALAEPAVEDSQCK